MPVECAHCGARAPDGTTRCPQCLRGTGLIEIPAGPSAADTRARTMRITAVAVTAVALAAAGAVGAVMFAKRPSTPRVSTVVAAAGVNPDELPAALDTGPALAPLVAQVRAAGDTTARARAVSDAVSTAMSTHGSTLVTEAADAPPARSPDGIDRALRTSGGRVTSLDLARLEVAVLRAAGTHADVAERTRAPRSDTPADPSGLLGSYVVVAGDTVIDVAAGLMVSAADTRPVRLDDRALTGAMLAQSALDASLGTGRADRALALANAAVETWRDGIVPLAVRSRAWLHAGASGGAPLAEQDLASAAGLRDDAALRLLHARLALLTGDAARASTEATAAHARASAWGDAALAYVILAPLTNRDADAGDPCAALVSAHDAWTDDALLLCRGESSPSDARSAAAARLMAGSTDPMRIAYAAASGAEGAPARVRNGDRTELVAWLLAMGRGDLARAIVGRPDAGH